MFSILKRALTFVLAFALVFAVLLGRAVLAQMYSGEAGDNITWTLNISGGNSVDKF